MKNTYEAVAVLSILVQLNRSFGGMIYSESKEIGIPYLMTLIVSINNS